MSTNQGRSGRNQFVQPRGPVVKLLVKPSEIVEGTVERRGEPKAIALTRADGLLEVTEEAARARQREGHGT